MDEKKLCLVIPSLQAGGMERVMAELATFFVTKKDTQVHLVLYGITREIFYPVPESVIVHSPLFKFNNTWRLFYTIRTLIFLRQKIVKIGPISILSFGEYWNNFLLIATLGLKYNIYVSDRSQPDKSLGWFQDMLRKRLYPRARGLIFQTEKAKQIYLKKHSHSNVTVIGNPIRRLDNLIIKSRRKNHILMVGRLIRTKHQDKLIEMFARIGRPDWKLILVGYDHLKQHNMTRLKKLAADLNCEQRVVFTGKRDNVDEFYLISSVFAFTSSSEGFPNVIGEAMSAGLPVVAFDCVAGPSELITDGHDGYLIPLYDYSLFQMKLEQLMMDENLREKLGNNGKESIKRFSSEKICEDYYKFITGHFQ